MSFSDKWSQNLQETKEASDFSEREAKIARISEDPKANFAPPPKRDYPTTEMHYILCVEEETANMSMPEASEQYGQPHKIGGLLLSDRRDPPLGWAKKPPAGTPIEAIQETYPEVYEVLKMKNVEKF